MSQKLKPPFPWFGGKSQVACLVWERLGDVPNYVEPFFGSGAMLLNRPHAPRVETVNDKDGFLSNFWRAVKADPDAVAEHADKMVNEIDLAAWRDWLYSDMTFQDHMWRDPEFYDVKRAGVWVWGVCSTIGNAWQPKATHLGNAGMGIHRARTHLGDAGMGESIRDYFRAISDRLHRVRVMSGNWSRVCTPAVTIRNGLTGMFLDPPYLDKCTATYNHNDDVRAAVRHYCMERGDDPKMRIALCGYEGEHDMPGDWECVAWKARGGYAMTDQSLKNAKRERIWFSPACLKVDLFSELAQ